MNKYVSDFLGVSVPLEITAGDVEVVESLTNERVREILAEREPQLYVDKAVFLNSDGKSMVLATVPVTEKMCKGHFDWFPMMPLALLGQATAQAGAILVSLISEVNSGKIPLVVHVHNIRSIGSKKKAVQKDFIVPGDEMLVVATYLGGKSGFHKVTAVDYVGDIMMGVMEEVAYILVDRSYFRNGEGR